MPHFFYQCPNKGFQVIAITPEGISEDDTTTFVPVHCYVCGEVHQVIPATGRSWQPKTPTPRKRV